MSNPFIPDFQVHTTYISASTAEFIRVACIAIACYDYILTLPAEWRIYKRHGYLRVSAILFFFMRYVSITLLTIGSYNWFFDGFDDARCARFYLLPTIFKVLQMMLSQAIMGWRTINIARRNRFVVFAVFILFSSTTIVEWFSTLYSRRSSVRSGHCRTFISGNTGLAWIFYLCALVYDLVMLITSFYFLFRIKSNTRMMSKLRKITLVDGLGYFVLLCVANIVNIMVFRANNNSAMTQNALSPVAYVVTWIMSQRILIHLNETLLQQKREEDIVATVTQSLSRHSQLSARSIEEISQEVQSQFRSSMTGCDYVEDRAEFKDETDGFDYMSSAGSSQRKDPTRRRHRARTPMSPIDSDCFLDSIVDVEVDVGVRPTPTTTITPTVVSGRRSIGTPHAGAGRSDTVCEEGGAGLGTKEKTDSEDHS